MAKLPGILPLRGTIQEMTFAHTKNGVVVKKKTSVTKERMDTDPAYVRTRESMADFKTASKSAKLLFTAFRNSIPAAKDSELFTRTQALMREAMSFDTSHGRGLKTVADGKPTLLEGFNFNTNSRLESLMFVEFTTTIDRVTGEVEVSLPAYVAEDVIVAPQGATHYRIVATAAELNFTDFAQQHNKQETGYLPLDNQATAASTLTCIVPENSTHPLAVSIGIEFFIDDNGTKYPLKDGSAHAVVKVDA